MVAGTRIHLLAEIATLQAERDKYRELWQKQSEMEALAHAATGYKIQRDESRIVLNNLLTHIHNDGGRYLMTYGVQDTLAKAYQLITEQQTKP